jgi:hypothetical protein
LTEGIGPTVEAAKSYSDYYKLCLKAMGNFLAVEVKQDEDLEKKCQLLFGRKALTWQYDQCAAEAKSGRDLNSKVLGPLRTYGWLLSGDQRQTSRAWIHGCAIARSGFCAKSIADGPAPDTKLGTSTIGGSVGSKDPAPKSKATKAIASS